MRSLRSLAASYSLSGKLDPQKAAQLVKSLAIKRSTILDYVYPNNIKVSTVHMKLAPCGDLRGFIERVASTVEAAVQAGSHLVVFPHLTGLLPIAVDKSAMKLFTQFVDEIVSRNTAPASLAASFELLMERFSDFLFDCYYNVFLLLAHLYNIYIAGGSTYVSTGQGVFCRSYVFSPDHEEALFQDKIQLTPWETAAGIKAGSELNVLDLKIGKAALLTDCDTSYYECCKVAKNLGAQLFITPALCTSAFSHNTRYNTSLMNAQQFGVYTVRSSFFSTGELLGKFEGGSGIYAPLSMSKNLDGIIVHTNDCMKEGIVLSARIEPPKLADHLDAYNSFRNPAFSEVMMNETYPAFFKNGARPLDAGELPAVQAGETL